MFYAAGSLLFAFALVAALIVIVMSFARHGAQMVAALRTLSLDGVHGRSRVAMPSPLVPAPSAGLAVRALPVRPLAA